MGVLPPATTTALAARVVFDAGLLATSALVPPNFARAAPAVGVGPTVAPLAGGPFATTRCAWAGIVEIVSAVLNSPKGSPSTRGVRAGPGPWLQGPRPTRLGSMKVVVPLPP
jgi:hypothetical protein